MAEHYRLREFLGPRYWPSWLGLLCMRLLAPLPLPVIVLIGGVLGELLYFSMPGVATSTAPTGAPVFRNAPHDSGVAGRTRISAQWNRPR